MLGHRRIVPSIQQQHCNHHCAVTVESYGNYDYRLIQFIIALISLIVSNQQIEHKHIGYLAIVGLATGLSAGVFIANLYLRQFDLWLLSQLDMHGIPYKLYKRYIDDICMIIRASDAQRVQEIANSWHESIRLKLSGLGNEHIPFLDLALSIVNNRWTYTLYRQPLAI